MGLDNYYTQQEAAQLIGVSRMTLYRWAIRGKLKPARSWGNTKLFTIRQIGEQVKNKSCLNCYHSDDSLCACREIKDMITIPNRCPDWRFIDGDK